MSKRPVIARLEVWSDFILISKKDWAKMVRFLKRSEIDVVYQTRGVAQHALAGGREATRAVNAKVKKASRR
jgi:hypothetical protein